MSATAQMSALFIDESCKLLDQSMLKIQNCLEQLSDDQIWWRPQEPLNSIGNLILHLDGNLRQWTIAGIGRADDNRDRPSEFSQRDAIEKKHLSAQLSQTVGEAKELFSSLSADQLLESRTIQEFDVTVLAAITHTTSHFVGHTHQIIYIARLILGSDYRFQWTPANERTNVPI